MQGERKTKRKRSFQNSFSEPQPTLQEAKIVQDERKTKRKRSFQICFSEPQPTLREAKIVQGERKTKRKRVKPPGRWLVVRGYGLDTLTNNQYQ